MMTSRSILAVMATMASAATLSNVRGPAPAPGSAPAPALSTMAVQWEIANLNYYDLSKPYDAEKHKINQGSYAEHAEEFANKIKKKDEDMPKQDDETVGPKGLGDVAKSIDKGVEGVAKGDVPAVTPPDAGMKDAAKGVDSAAEDAADGADDVVDALNNVGNAPRKQPSQPSLIELASVDTLHKVLRRSIEETIKETICSPELVAMGPVPAPAPAPAIPSVASKIPPPVNAPGPAAAVLLSESASLRGAPAPGPMAAPAPAPVGQQCAQPKVHVEFVPGKEIKVAKPSLKAALLAVPGTPSIPPTPRTVMVKASLFDRPQNGVDDLAAATVVLQHAVANGQLMTNIQQAVKKVVGFTPKLKGLDIKPVLVKAWDIEKCEGHMSKLIKVFGVHYTRRQVPMALYNECTNFMTKISFSHDYVLDPIDEKRCRVATKKFALRWKLGKNDNPGDFEDMCVRFCEAKFGNDAPLCHVTHGEKLLNQPL